MTREELEKHTNEYMSKYEHFIKSSIEHLGVPIVMIEVNSQLKNNIRTLSAGCALFLEPTKESTEKQAEELYISIKEASNEKWRIF